MRKTLACFCLLLTLCMFIPSALPPVQAQANNAANPLGCTLTALLNAGSPTTATTRIITAAAASSKNVFINGVATSVPTTPSIKICAFAITVNQAAGAADFGLVLGTGTNCGTGTTNVTSQFFGTASVKESKQQEYSSGTWLIVPPGKDLCVAVSASPTNVRATVLYRLE